MLIWDAPDESFYEHGINRGVLYPSKVPDGQPTAYAWNGITGFDEGSSGESTVLYRDGRVFLADVDASDFSGHLTAFTFPDPFGECIGIGKVADGFHVDNQKPKRFGFCYRTLVGSGAADDQFGYQIHLIYNAVASVAPRSRKTATENISMVEFEFDLVCTPIHLAGYRPSAHYIIDTRGLGEQTLKDLETILYGEEFEPLSPLVEQTFAPLTSGRLPTPDELANLLSYGDKILYTDNGDGTWTARGANKNVVLHDDGTFEIHNTNGVDHGDGTYTLSDTP